MFCKQKTAYEMRISDWSSDVCSSDLPSGDRLASSTLSRLPKAVAASASLICCADAGQAIAASDTAATPTRSALAPHHTYIIWNTYHPSNRFYAEVRAQSNHSSSAARQRG